MAELWALNTAKIDSGKTTPGWKDGDTHPGGKNSKIIITLTLHFLAPPPTPLFLSLSIRRVGRNWWARKLTLAGFGPWRVHWHPGASFRTGSPSFLAKEINSRLASPRPAHEHVRTRARVPLSPPLLHHSHLTPVGPAFSSGLYP